METKVKYVCLFGDQNTGVVIGSINTNSVKVLAVWMQKNISCSSASSALEFRLWADGKRRAVSVGQLREIAATGSEVYSKMKIAASIRKNVE